MVIDAEFPFHGDIDLSMLARRPATMEVTTISRDSQLAAEFNRFASLLATPHSARDALHQTLDSVVTLLGLDGAGASIARDDRLLSATATSSSVAQLVKVQEATQEGPRIDSFRSGTPVLVVDIAAQRESWPALAQEASRHGVVAIGAIPLQVSGRRMGVLDLTDTRPREWSDGDVDIALTVAALAGGLIANASRLEQATVIAEQLQQALDSRVVIEQAKGILAAEYATSVDEAFRVLRGHARRHSAPLREVAHAVVAGGLRPPRDV